MIKQAIATVTPRFSARRMVKEYVERAYAPACDHRDGGRSVEHAGTRANTIHT
jgi:glucan phosphorylase